MAEMFVDLQAPADATNAQSKALAEFDRTGKLTGTNIDIRLAAQPLILSQGLLVLRRDNACEE